MVDERADLYALPLEEFTNARNELAARLKEGGEQAAAQQIGKMKRPTVAAWAVNQLARQEAKDLQRLFELRTELEGAAAPADLRRLAQERRRLLSNLADRARSILEAGGHPSSAGTIDKVSQTLMAGDTDEERGAILEGTLAKELSPSGFGSFGGPLLETDDEDVAEDPPRSDPKVERLQQELEDALAGVDRLQKIAFEAEASADAAREQLQSAERAAERIQKRLEKASGGS